MQLNCRKCLYFYYTRNPRTYIGDSVRTSYLYEPSSEYPRVTTKQGRFSSSGGWCESCSLRMVSPKCQLTTPRRILLYAHFRMVTRKRFDLKSSWIGRRWNRHYSLWSTENGITVIFDRAYRGCWRMADRGVLYRTSSRNSCGTVSFGKFFIPVMAKSHTQSADRGKHDRSYYLRVLRWAA